MKSAKWLYEGPAIFGAAMMTASPRGASLLILGMLGDGYPLSEIGLGFEVGRLPVSTIALGRRELSLGAQEKFLAALKRQDEVVSNGVIMVAQSGAASLLKEDIPLMVRDFVSQNQNRLLLLRAHPIRDLEYGAAEKSLLQLVEEFARGKERSERPSVNIIGPSLLDINARGDALAMRALIESLGAQVSALIPLEADLSDFAALPRAWANVTTSPEVSLASLKFLQERFGQPYLLDLPIGFEGSERFRQNLAELLGLVPPAPLTASLTQVKADMRVAVFAGAGRALGIARFLKEEARLKEVLAGTFLKGFKDYFEGGLKETGAKTLVTDDASRVDSILEDFSPDLILGTYNEWMCAERLGAAFMMISAPADRFHFVQASHSFLGPKGAERLTSLLGRAAS
ncbi:MAG: nitrogenase component 1 [Actinomycetota bacterium]|nr:nitrogenase component 1 [Actinomycetota bacterium]